MENGAAALANWWFLSKIHIELYEPGTPVLGMPPGEMKTCPHKNLYTNLYTDAVHSSITHPAYPLTASV